MKSCSKSLSAGHRKSSSCILSMISFRSEVYRPVGANGFGFGFNFGRSPNGSPVMFRRIRNGDGKWPIMGFVRRATGLYFLLANILTFSERRYGFGKEQVVSKIGIALMGFALFHVFSLVSCLVSKKKVSRRDEVRYEACKVIGESSSRIL